MYCPKCGNQISDTAAFCNRCGARVRPAQAQPGAWTGQTQSPYGGQKAPPPKKKSGLWIAITISAVALAGMCVAVCAVLIAGHHLRTQISAMPTAAMADETSWIAPTAMPTARPLPKETAQPAQTLSAQTISVSMAYDSGEGIYTGEVENGVPNGYGSFQMLASANGRTWSYEGQWADGEITGEGVLTQENLVYRGVFNSGLLDGACEITDSGVLRYQGMCQSGQLSGQGTLYTRSGRLLFQGEFQNDMMAESDARNQARTSLFLPECQDMDDLLYANCLDGYDVMDCPVFVWGPIWGMSEQTSTGALIIGHMDDGNHPLYLEYRYRVGEEKMTAQSGWVNAWGVVTGLYEYTDENGDSVTCPRVEVIFWNSQS